MHTVVLADQRERDNRRASLDLLFGAGPVVRDLTTELVTEDDPLV